MIIIVFMIFGVILGALSLGERGLIWGAVVGYLVGRTIKLDRTLDQLGATVRHLKQQLRTLQNAAPQRDEPESTEAEIPAVASAIKQVKKTGPELAMPSTGTGAPPEPDRTLSPKDMTPQEIAKPQDTTKHQATTSPVKPAQLISTISENQSESVASKPLVEDGVIWRVLKNYFTGGNTLVRVGIIILFIGMSFLAKYAADKGIVPIEFRMAGLALVGLVLLVIGWRLRSKRGGYAMALQGGGIGITYLTIFASFRLYHLLPATLAFGLMLAVCVMSATLAVLMNARSLAILGFSFGFLAPILTSTGGGSHVMLFTYYTLLNVGIFGIAWFKSWRPLNLTGFVFTFAIGSLWGVTKYQPSLFASTEPFLVGFFLFYVAISVLYAVKQSVNIKGYVDGTLVFGTPIIAFSLQTALVRNIEYGLAYSSLAMCVFYVLLATGLFKFAIKKESQKNFRLLCESFLSIGVVFGTVAIPLALDDHWTAAAWALEGAALTYIAVRQQRDLAYFSGLLLQFGSALFVLRTFGHSIHSTHWPVINGVYINGLIMAVAGLISAYVSFRYHEKIKRYINNTDQVMLVWGIGWWLFSGVYEINHHTSDHHFIAWFLAFGALTVVIGHMVGGRLSWPSFRKLDQGLVAFMLLSIAGTLAFLSHPFAHSAWIGWLVVYPVYYGLLKRTDETPLIPYRVFLHGAGIWIATLLLTWEIAWQVSQVLPRSSVWSLVIWLLVPSCVLMLLHLASKKMPWPFMRHADAYYGVVSFPVIAFMLLALVVSAVGHSGDPSPLTYIPLFNPLDLASLFVVLSVTSWWIAIKPVRIKILHQLEPVHFYTIIAAIVFLLINSALLKSIHHWYLVPLNLEAMIKSDLVQTALTILWSMIAMSGMLIASKRQWRKFWVVGGVLLSIVVVKLFTLDLANVGTVERIVSFIFVGGLMLVIGYFTPIPPKTRDSSNA